MIIPIFNTVFLIMYLLSAAVQYNDPDALLWILIYLFAAGMCIARMRKKQQRWLPRTLLVVSLLWMGSLLPHIVGQTSLAEVFASISMQSKAVEEAREIGGLFEVRCCVRSGASLLVLVTICRSVFAVVHRFRASQRAASLGHSQTA